MTAAPTPWTARNASSVPIVGAAPQATDMSVNSARPKPKLRRLAGRSAIEPGVRTVAASAAGEAPQRQRDGGGVRDPLDRLKACVPFAGDTWPRRVDPGLVEHEHRGDG